MFNFVLGPAPDTVTNTIYNLTKKIKNYSIIPNLECNISEIGIRTFEVSLYITIY